MCVSVFFCFFRRLLAVLEAADTTHSVSDPAPTATSNAPADAVAALSDLVFNGVCFETGFPLCGKGFTTAFYGLFQMYTHTHAQIDREANRHMHNSICNSHISYIIYLNFAL